MTLPSVYSPQEVEAHWYAEWEKEGYFQPDGNAPQGPFTIVIPPPNVTGILHMGHALNNTLQDILIRFRRMQGFAALWVPGTDHAGIATQNVVERQLAKEGLTRQMLGRQEFIKRVWAWRGIYGSTIVRQLRRLGSSCDWSRERFTMDDRLSRAVETAFLKLHEAGLIYRGYYLVNWCPRCQTALSDEEVQHEEVKGYLWYIRYPDAGTFLKGEGVIVATTRPETMLGDVAVAVHPKDRRYRGQAGRIVEVPLTGRNVPLIFDEAVDQKFGTGVVKVTPAHDPVDFAIAQRHPDELIPLGKTDWTSIPINIFTPDAHLAQIDDVPDAYQGLDRFECRKRIVADLDAEGFLVKTEDYVHSVGHCYRCKTIIEPHLSPQWFVKMEPLAKLGIEAVEKDGMRFIPERWAKVYLDWLTNIRDWCISRQIWWGHQIPIWYCPECNKPKVQGRGRWERGRYVEPGMVVAPKTQMEASSTPACPTCKKKVSWKQDEDVLDTWFSSWLWPFSTLGWPEETKDLKTFYPTSVLVTGQDILFFWVARMVMAGKFFMGKIPFRDVVIHGIIRVEGGKKMSKSLGNIIDPLSVIDRMGADALRFSLAHMTSEGQDLYLSEAKFLLGRNFANKLWNAARLILETEDRAESEATWALNPRSLTLADRWILSRLQQGVGEVTQALQGYHFNESARLLYQFIWHELCDWYLEIAKLQREDPDLAVVKNTNQILRMVLETTLRLLHPFMPFITEELWQKVQGEGNTIMKAPWPQPNPAWSDGQAQETFSRLQSVITEVRNIRATFRVPVKERVSLLVQAEKGVDLLAHHEEVIRRLANVDSIQVSARIPRPGGCVVSHLPPHERFGAWDLIVPLSGLVDLDLERKRIQKEVEALESRAQAKRTRLNDSTFRSKAPSEVIAEEEESLKELEAQLSRWTESLKGMEG